MAVSIADIQNLRKRTGAGMMDCKNALAESNGDIDKAIEIIRKKGQAFAAKRGDRDASEGCVLADTKGDFAALVAINCETDFVAINADFIGMTTTILNTAIANKPADKDALAKVDVDGHNVIDTIVARGGITGEKMELGAYEQISAPSVVAYVHPGNKLAAIVGFNKENVDEQIGRDIAMQIAAMNPLALTADGVSADLIEKEKVVAKEKALAEGKPENIIDRIVDGSVAKFLKENTLLEQAFVKDPKQTITQYLASKDKDLKITEFKRFSLSAE